MGWEWKDDDNDDVSSKYGGDVDVFDESSNPRGRSGDGDRCSTRKVVKSQCRTEEVEPGKFIRKCEKTESIFKDCLGRPSEVVQSNKEYTEEDVTEQVVKFSENGPFDFPGLRSDMEAIERSFLGGIGRFFEAAEEMKKGLFNVFGDPHFYDGDSSSSSTRRGIPIEAHPPPTEASPKPEGHVDLSGPFEECPQQACPQNFKQSSFDRTVSKTNFTASNSATNSADPTNKTFVHRLLSVA